jgi:hypothetical protein
LLSDQRADAFIVSQRRRAKCGGDVRVRTVRDTDSAINGVVDVRQMFLQKEMLRSIRHNVINAVQSRVANFGRDVDLSVSIKAVDLTTIPEVEAIRVEPIAISVGHGPNGAIIANRELIRNIGPRPWARCRLSQRRSSCQDRCGKEKRGREAL